MDGKSMEKAVKSMEKAIKSAGVDDTFMKLIVFLSSRGFQSDLSTLKQSSSSLKRSTMKIQGNTNENDSARIIKKKAARRATQAKTTKRLFSKKRLLAE